jgi:hypothetical protein
VERRFPAAANNNAIGGSDADGNSQLCVPFSVPLYLTFSSLVWRTDVPENIGTIR